MSKFQNQIDSFMQHVRMKNPGEPEFHQAVLEVAESIIPFMESNTKYKKSKILERLVEPERVLMFRVPWIDDKGELCVNR